MNEAIPVVWNSLHGENLKIKATSLGLKIYQSKNVISMTVGQITSRLQDVVGRIIQFLPIYFATHLRNNLLQSQRLFVVFLGAEDTSIKVDTNRPQDIIQNYY